MLYLLKAIRVNLFLSIIMLPAILLAQPSRTPWEMHEGLEITTENPYGVSLPGPDWPAASPLDPIWYSTAIIPTAADAGWGPAPDGDIIAFGGPSASVIDEAGYGCWDAYDYTYFNTYVTIPENTTLTDFTISFSGMDDGSRITIINSAYPAGLVIPGSYVTGGGTTTSDLASYVTTGENRVVITQIDVCPNGNALASAVVVLNGETVAVNQAPMANAGPDQAVTRTGALTDVTLDGSASSDTDVTDVLTYSWAWTGGTASGVAPTISLAAGTYDIVLTVDDQNGGIDTDNVEIIVDTTPYAQTFTVLGALGNVGETDPYIQALPEGATEWSQAYLTGAHPWGYVPGTNSWLNFDPDDEVGLNTRTPYRIRFMVPEDATDPSMVFQVKADNRAVIWVNDTFIDSIDDAGTLEVSNSVAGPALHTGLNEIRITMVDWGGIVGINYRIDVSMTSADDITDAVLTPEDAAELNNAPIADAGSDQTVETVLTTHVVTLNASGSSDDDGNLLSYSWSEDGSEIATGVMPALTLSAGTHTITLTAFDGELSSTDDVIVTIEQIVPLAADTPVPASGSVDVSLEATLSWTSVEGATGYLINFGTDNPPTTIENGTDLGDMLSFAPSALENGMTYYWSVTPYNAAGNALAAPVWSFTTEGAPATEQTFTVYGAIGNAGETDPYIQALPEGATEWQQAYLIGPHPWGQVEGTTSWINFDPDPSVGVNTTTPYRIRFLVPEDAVDPSMTFHIKADNRALIWVNDTYIDSVDGEDMLDVPDAVIGEALHTGVNEIRISLVDWGSIVGINYRIDVTMTSAEDISDALLTPEDAAELNNAPIADAGEDQLIDTYYTSGDVILDASGSSDMDGNLLTYTWNIDGEELAFGEMPTVNLGVGTHTISMTASDGELSDTDDVQITVTQVAPMAATVPIPASAATEVALDQSLSWSTASGATGYQLSFGTDNPPTSIEMGTDLGDIAAYSPDGLDYGTTYYWSVTPYNEAGSATGVQVWSFSTLEGNSGPLLEVSVTSVDFGEVALGDTAQRYMTLTNLGDAPLDFSFTERPEYPPIGIGSYTSPMAPGASAEVLVWFDPIEAGPVADMLTITSNDPSSPHEIPVMGVATSTMVEGESCENPIVFDDINGPGMYGYIESGDHDWYSFSTDGSFSLINVSTCNSEGIEDTKLAVFADCADFTGWPEFGAPEGTIGYIDDFCDLNSEVTLFDLPAGTYYVAVYGYSVEDVGEYTLDIFGTGVGGPCIDLVDMYEPNDDMESAASLPNGAAIEASICPTGDSDWFVVSASAGSWITVQTSTISYDEFETDTYLNLYNEAGILLAADDDGADFGYTSLLSVPLMEDGLFFIEVISSPFAAEATFDYGMSVVIEEGPAPAPQNLVATGGDGVVNLTWDPAPLMPLVLRNADGVSPLKTSNPKNNLSPEKANLRSIYAEKTYQRYSVMTTAGTRELGETCDEAIEYGGVNSAPVIGDLLAGGQDWYSFTTDGSYDGINLTLCNSDGVSDPQLAVFSDCGDVIGLPYLAVPPPGSIGFNDDACELMADINLMELAAGTYYVAVWGYTESDFGAYELGISELSNTCEGFVDMYEPNNAMGEATPVASDDMLNAALCPTEDSDWYVVSAMAQQTISFVTLPLSTDEFLTDTYLNLYDAAGNLVDSDDDSGPFGYTSMISYQLPEDGTYYLEVIVSSNSTGSAFDYVLSVNVDELPPGMSWNVYRDEDLLVSGVGMNMFSDMSVSNGTTYCYTVTQIFEDESESDFSNVDCATPEAALMGDLCSNPIPLMLPVMGQEGSSEGFNNDYDGSDFMSGIDIVYSFSLPEDGTLSGSIMDGGDEWTAMFVMDACPDAEANLIAMASGSSGGSFADAPIGAGDYLLIVSNWPSPYEFSYSFDLSYMAGPMGMVELLSPVSHMMVSTLTPEFLWQSHMVPYEVASLMIGGDKEDVLQAEEAANNSVELVLSYDLHLGMTPDLSDAMAFEVIGNRFTPAEDLMEDHVYFWAVSANDDDGSVFYSDTTSFWTNSMNSVPMEFSLISPLEDGMVGSLMPTFSWEAAMDEDLEDEISYNIYMGASIDELTMVTTGLPGGIMETEFTMVEPIEDNTTYYWTVEAMDSQGATTTNMEGYRSFHANLVNDAPSMVDLVTPDSVLVLSLNPEMYWTASFDMDPQDVVSYEMHWWGEDMMYDSVLTDTHSVILPQSLADNSIYYWDVLAMDGHGGMSQSEPAFFWTDLAPEPPMDFALLSPANDATGLPDLPVFEWEVANDPDPMDYATYTLEIATDPEFSNVISTTETSTAVGFEVTESLTVNTEYWWRVIAMDSDDLSTVSAISKFTVGTVSLDNLAALPDDFIMQQNYPNPFNPSTTIRYGIPEDAQVTVMIYDVRGDLVRTIESGYQSAGWYEAIWNGLSDSGQPVSTGLYLARFQAGNYAKTVKMLYLK